MVALTRKTSGHRFMQILLGFVISIGVLLSITAGVLRSLNLELDRIDIKTEDLLAIYSDLKMNISLPNASLAWLERPISNSTTPETFGGIGDGIVDDTNAIQEALNTTSIVFLAPGKVYRITHLLNVPTGGGIESSKDEPATLLMGTNVGEFDESKMANSTGSICSAYPISMGVGIIIIEKENVTLRHFKLVMEWRDGLRNIGLAARNSTNVSIHNIEFTGFSLACGVLSLDTCTKCIVSRTYIHDIYSNCPNGRQVTALKIDDNRMDDKASRDLFIINNTIRNISTGPAFSEVWGNQTDGIHVAGAGINIDPTNHILITGNHIEHCDEGIDSYGADMIIEHNTIVDCFFTGIKLIHGASRHFISWNHFMTCADYAVLLGASNVSTTDTCENIIYNNIISGIGNHSMKIRGHREIDAAICLGSCASNCMGRPSRNIVWGNEIHDAGEMELLVHALSGDTNIEGASIADSWVLMRILDQGGHITSLSILAGRIELTWMLFGATLLANCTGWMLGIRWKANGK